MKVHCTPHQLKIKKIYKEKNKKHNLDKKFQLLEKFKTKAT